MVYVAKADNIDPENPRQGFKPIPPGYYHVQIEKMQEDEKKQAFVILTLTIIGVEKNASKEPIGENHREYIYFCDNSGDTKWADKKFTSIMYCCGLVTQDQIRKFVASGNGVPILFDEMPGRTLVVKLSKKKDKDGNETQYNEVGLNWFPLDSKEAKLVDLHPSFANANATPANDAQFQQAAADDLF